MAHDELDELDREWREERTKFLVYEFGKFKEPAPSQHFIVYIVLVSFVGAGILVGSLLAPEMSARERLSILGAGAILVGGGLFFSIYQMRRSRAYELARAAYLRKRASLEGANVIPDGAFTETASAPASFRWQPFSAMAVFHFVRDRLFRIRSDGVSLYFIRVAAQMDAHGVSMRMIDAVDQGPLSEFIGGHVHDMVIQVDDIAWCVIDLPGILDFGHGRSVGIWRMRLTNGKKWKFQFTDNEEMRRAIATLSALLGNLVQINAHWDEEKRAFVKVWRSGR